MASILGENDTRCIIEISGGEKQSLEILYYVAYCNGCSPTEQHSKHLKQENKTSSFHNAARTFASNSKVTTYSQKT